MAGNWIEWCKGLASKREVQVMAALLKRDRHEIAGRLMCIWEWLDDNVPEENINTNTGDAVIEMSPRTSDNKAFIESLGGLPGLVESMTKVGWILFKSSSVFIPKFGRHNGDTAKTRGRNTKNQAKRRARLENPVIVLSPNTGDKNVTTGQKTGQDRTGSSTKSQTGQSGVLKKLLAKEDLVVADLKDTKRLFALSRSLAVGDSYFATEEGMAHVVGSALRVLGKLRGANPPDDAMRVFSWIISGKRWSEISSDEMDLANDIIKRDRQRTSSETAIADFAERLAFDREPTADRAAAAKP